MANAERGGGAPMLAGLRIIEVPAFVAAPLCGLTLAQLGADVIRVDPPGGNIDIDRAPLAPSGRSLYWASLNAGKRSIEIDFRVPRGKALLARLLARSGADGGILITNLSLGAELSYEALVAARPDLIMIRLAGSPDGRSEVDYTVNCAVGFPMITGTGDEPVNHVLPAWDAVAGLTLATAVLVAERHRRKTGQGQLVTLSLSDVAMGMVSNLSYIADVQVNGATRRKEGNHLYGAFGCSFETADHQYVMVAALTDRQWQSVLQALEIEAQLLGAASSLGYDISTSQARYDAREFIATCLRPWFAKRSRADIETKLAKHRVLYGVYRTFQQMLDEDERCSEANPMFKRIEQPGIGNVLSAGSPLDFAAADRLAPQPAALLGEHTASVLSEMGGLGADEIEDLINTGVIGRGSQKDTQHQPAMDRHV